MVMQLRTCCCCFTPRTGTIIIAVLGIIGGISIIVDGIVGSEAPGAKTNTTGLLTATNILGSNLNNLNPIDVVGDAFTTESPVPGQASGNGTSADGTPDTYGFSVTKTIYGVIETIVNTLLLVGAIKNSAKLIFPWIVMSVILCVLYLLIYLGIGIMFCVGGAVAVGLTSIIIALLGAAFYSYFILVVNSFHTNLKAGPPVSRA